MTNGKQQYRNRLQRPDLGMNTEAQSQVRSYGFVIDAVALQLVFLRVLNFSMSVKHFTSAQYSFICHPVDEQWCQYRPEFHSILPNNTSVIK